MKLNTCAVLSATLLAATSSLVFAKCNDSMDSYIKFSIAGGCSIVKAATEKKYTQEMGTMYMLGLNEHCSTFGNGVTKEDLNAKFPILTAQSPDTCTVKAQHAAITEIRKTYNIK